LSAEAVGEISSDVDQHLADRPALDRVVCRRGRVQRVMMQRKAGLLPDAQRSGGDGCGDVLGRGGEQRLVKGIEQARMSRTRTCPGPGSGTGRSASRMTVEGPFSA